MGLSELFKKYGSKDFIILDFNPETLKYEYHLYRGGVIPYKKLDKESRKELDSKNNELLANPNLVNEELKRVERKNKAVDRYKELKSMGYECSSTMILSDKPITPMPESFSNQLDNMLSEEHVLYGIHRIGNMSLEFLEDVLENGLIMTGHGLNVSQDALSLSQNVAYYPDNYQIKTELEHAHGYKHSNGSFLIRIPDEDLKNGNLFIEREGEFKRLNPKYIVGFVPIIELPNGTVTIDRIVTLKDLKSTEEKVEVPSSEEIINDESYEVENTEGRAR